MWQRAIVVIVLLLLPTGVWGQPGKRVALLIGNEAYSSELGRLTNPHNDIALLDKALKGLGFEVTTVRDADLGALHEAVNAHARRLQAAGANAIGFFYYSGHGAADGGTNYLIPVNVKTTDTAELWDKSLRLTEITRKLKAEAGTATHFVVFDACRNTLKLTRAGARSLVQSKGFVPIAQESGMLIAYATAEGELASDVGIEAGPYAKTLAEEIIKPGIEAVAMFRIVQRRVRAAINQEPYLGFSAMGDVYLAGIRDPGPPDRGAAIAPAPKAGAPKPSADLPEYAELIVTDVDYLPDLRGGLFGGRNSIGLAFDSEGTTNFAMLGVGTRSRSLPMKYAPADEYAFRLLEYGWGTHEISNVQTMKASELGKRKQFTFRIRESTFAANSNIDPKRKTVSLAVQLLPFDPEKASGPDQSEAGAHTLSPGQAVADTVSFIDQDMTDYVRLTAGKGVCVLQLLSGGQSDDGNVSFSMKDAQSKAKFERVKQLADLRIWTTPCDAAAGTTFRVLAAPLSGQTKYHVAVVQDSGRGADFAKLLEVMLLDFMSGAGSARPQDDPERRLERFVRSVSELRRHLRVDDASPTLKQCEQLLLNPSSTYDDARLSRLVAALLTSESNFYRAAEDSAALRMHLALYLGENDKPYDRGALLTALQSGQLSAAERAVRIVGKIKDQGFVRATLTPLLLDPRDSVARAAREQILALDRPALPNRP